MTGAGELLRRMRPVPTAVPPSGSGADPRQRRFDALACVPSPRGVPPELLAERHRRASMSVCART